MTILMTNFGKTVYDYFKNEHGIVCEDEVNDFKEKYRNHTKNQLKQTLRKLKSDKTAENTSETRYVSKLIDLEYKTTNLKLTNRVHSMALIMIPK